MTAVGWIKSEVASVISKLLLPRQMGGPPVLSWSSDNRSAKLKKIVVPANSSMPFFAEPHCCMLSSDFDGRLGLDAGDFGQAEFQCIAGEGA